MEDFDVDDVKEKPTWPKKKRLPIVIIDVNLAT